MKHRSSSHLESTAQPENTMRLGPEWGRSTAERELIGLASPW